MLVGNRIDGRARKYQFREVIIERGRIFPSRVFLVATGYARGGMTGDRRCETYSRSFL